MGQKLVITRVAIIFLIIGVIGAGFVLNSVEGSNDVEVLVDAVNKTQAAVFILIVINAIMLTAMYMMAVNIEQNAGARRQRTENTEKEDLPGKTNKLRVEGQDQFECENCNTNVSAMTDTCPNCGYVFKTKGM